MRNRFQAFACFVASSLLLGQEACAKFPTTSPPAAAAKVIPGAKSGAANQSKQGAKPPANPGRIDAKKKEALSSSEKLIAVQLDLAESLSEAGQHNEAHQQLKLALELADKFPVQSPELKKRIDAVPVELKEHLRSLAQLNLTPPPTPAVPILLGAPSDEIVEITGVIDGSPGVRITSIGQPSARATLRRRGDVVPMVTPNVRSTATATPAVRPPVRPEPHHTISSLNLPSFYWNYRDGHPDATEIEYTIKSQLTYAEKTYGPNSFEYVNKLLELLTLYSRQARFGDCRPYIVKVVAVFPKMTPAQQSQAIPPILESAQQFSDHQKFMDAESLIMPVALAATNAKWENINDIAPRLERLTQNLISRQRYPQAETVIKAAVALYEHATPKDEARLANLRAELANVLQQEGKYGAADELFRMALAAEEKQWGEGNAKSFDTLLKMQQFYAKNKKMPEAKALLPKFIKSLQNNPGRDRREMIKNLMEICGFFVAAGELAAADTVLERTMQMIAHSGNLQEYEIREPMNKLASEYASAGHPEKGEAIFVNVLAKRKESGDTASTLYSSAVLELMRFYSQSEMADKALPLVPEVVRLARANPNNYQYRAREMAQTFENAGYLKVAEELYKQSAESRQGATAEDKQQQLSEYYSLINLLNKQGKSDGVALYTKRVVDSVRALIPKEHADLGIQIEGLYLQYANNKSMDELMGLASDLAHSSMYRNGDVGEFVQRMLYRFQRSGDDAMKENFYKKGLAILEKAYGTDSIQLSSMLYNYASLLKSKGKLEEAQQMEKRAREIGEKHNRTQYQHYSRS